MSDFDLTMTRLLAAHRGGNPETYRELRAEAAARFRGSELEQLLALDAQIQAESAGGGWSLVDAETPEEREQERWERVERAAAAMMPYFLERRALFAAVREACDAGESLVLEMDRRRQTK
jgi:hypothetical protein